MRGKETHRENLTFYCDKIIIPTEIIHLHDQPSNLHRLQMQTSEQLVRLPLNEHLKVINQYPC